MKQLRFAVIDIETTGLDPDRDAVVSVAVVPVEAGTVREDLGREVLVDPGRPIPPEATRVNGITDDDVAGAVDLASAIEQLAPLLADRIVAGHNVRFDLAFLRRADFEPEEVLDTLAVSRLLWTGRGLRHSLDHLSGRVGVHPEDRHTAIGDALATAQALVACLPLLEDRGWHSPADVTAAYRAQRRRRARLKRSIRRRSIPRQKVRLSRPPRSAHPRR